MIGSCLCGGVAVRGGRPAAPGDRLPLHAMPQSLGPFLGGKFGAKGGVSTDQRWGAARGIAVVRSAPAGVLRGLRGLPVLAPDGQGTMHFAPGAMDGPTGLQIAEEWYLEDAGDYYTPARRRQGACTGSCLCGANQFTVCLARWARFGPAIAASAARRRGILRRRSMWRRMRLIWAEKVVQEYVTPGGAARGFCPVLRIEPVFSRGGWHVFGRGRGDGQPDRRASGRGISLWPTRATTMR